MYDMYENVPDLSTKIILKVKNASKFSAGSFRALHVSDLQKFFNNILNV